MSSFEHNDEDDGGWEVEQLSDDDIDRVLEQGREEEDLQQQLGAGDGGPVQRQEEAVAVSETRPDEGADGTEPEHKLDQNKAFSFCEQKCDHSKKTNVSRGDNIDHKVLENSAINLLEDLPNHGEDSNFLEERPSECLKANGDESGVDGNDDNATKRREEETRKAAVVELNSRLGRDPASLADIEEIVDQLQQAKSALEQKLQFVLTAAPDQLSEAVQGAEAGLEQGDTLQLQTTALLNEVSGHQEAVQKLLGGVQQELQLLQQQDRVRCYQGWVRSVQQISEEMVSLSSSTSSGNDETELLVRYSELNDTLRHIAGYTACGHLQDYVLHTLQYWHGRLLQHFSQELESVLKCLKYPFISTNTSARQPKPSPDLIIRLQALIKHLLRLHQPLEPGKLAPATQSGSSVNSTALTGSDDAIITKDARLSADGVDGQNSSLLNSSLSSDGSTRESVTSSGRFSSASSSPIKGGGTSGPGAGDREAPSQPAIVADFAPLVTPLQLLLKPLEVRFLYHFSGSKKTNSAAHPEWCLTRVLTWINEHADFLGCHVQPVLDKCQYGHLRAQTELSRGLVRLVVLKLSQDLPSVMGDEDLFCHSLQETLSFERELRLCCEYPGSQPSVLTVLTRPRVLDHWLRLERKFAVAVMDELVSMSGAWQTDQLEQEGGGVTACAEQFVTLLQGITDRYKPLPQPGHRLQFLEVQLDVLDEFRVRAVQLARELQLDPVASHYPAILCTLHHLACTLRDWGDMPFFLELGIYRNQQRQLLSAVEARLAGDTVSDAATTSAATRTSSPEPCSVFEESVSLYEHVQREMLATLLDHVMTLLRARFMPYRRDKWFLEPGKSGSSVRCSDVSGSLCPLLEVLARQLHCLRSALAPSLFSQLWHTIAAEIDKFLYEELVLQNHFSEVGCVQFEYDMTRALFPMFSEFTARPESYFPFVQESLLLMTLPLAPALLLRDTLRQAHQSSHRSRAADAIPAVVEPVAALADHGVTRITPENAFAVLQARNNVSVI